jgi:phage terminase large subunit
MSASVQVSDAFKALYRPKRYCVFFGGRGGAKSWAVAQAVILRAAREPIRVLCTREFQGSIRESVHKLLSDTIERIGVDHLFRVEQSAIHGKNGSRIIFEGLRNNVTKIKSLEALDLVWVEEADSISSNSWDILIPTVREEGSAIWVTFNPVQETDATYKRFVEPYLARMESTGTMVDGVLTAGTYEDDRVYIRKVSWRDNPWLTSELRREMDDLKRDDPPKYLHIWEGECKAAAQGAIYADQLRTVKEQHRITSIPIETNVPVNTFWDLGRNDVTAIFFHQRVGHENRFIDYYESRLVGLDHYARMLKEKGYLYGDHYLPHDAAVTELSTNLSRKQTLESMGVKPLKIVPRIKNLANGIEQTRQAFPSCWFDRERCSEGIKALANYQYRYDDQYGTYRDTPLHNWASNGADAFRQFAQGYREREREPRHLGHERLGGWAM